MLCRLRFFVVVVLFSTEQLGIDETVLLAKALRVGGSVDKSSASVPTTQFLEGQCCELSRTKTLVDILGRATNTVLGGGKSLGGGLG